MPLKVTFLLCRLQRRRVSRLNILQTGNDRQLMDILQGQLQGLETEVSHVKAGVKSRDLLLPPI